MKREKGAFFDIGEIASKIPEGSYWIDFIKVRHLEAGVLKLSPREEDMQGPHDEVELYFVGEGSGRIDAGKESRPVSSGSIVFVPAHVPHHFYGNKDELVVLYMFAE
jgi:mannose-6-phosphate isomerase-like protein (cupin superfamily)